MNISAKQFDIRERYKPIKIEKKLLAGLKSLRRDVENQGKGTRIVLLGSTFKSPLLNEVKTLNYHPWEIGYKVEPINIHQGFFKRTVFIKVKGERILDIPEKEMEPIVGAVIKELFDIGSDIPEMSQIADDCMKFTQRFAIVFWHEGNPNLVVHGGK